MFSGVIEKINGMNWMKQFRAIVAIYFNALVLSIIL